MKSLVLIDENIPLLAESLAPALDGAAETAHYAGRIVPRERLERCEALFVRSVTRVDGDVVDETPIVFVGTATSGVEHIDTDYLRRRGVHFADAAGCNANSVAEYVVYALLKWADTQQRSLRGQTLGVVGYGNIGKRVAGYALRLGMKVLVSDPPLEEQRYAFPADVAVKSLRDLLAESDAVTSHIPFQREGKHATVGMFGEREFALMKSGALFIHTSRRHIASEAALLEAMRAKRLHAAIDVWETEPVANKELATLALVATPHIAGYSYEGKINGSQMMAESYAKFFGASPDMSVFERALARENGAEADFADEQALYELLRETRRLDEDTDMLLETLGALPHQHSTLFDRLRKHYPVRRETLK